MASRLIPKKVGFERDAARGVVVHCGVPRTEPPAEPDGEVMAKLWAGRRTVCSSTTIALSWATPAMVILHPLSDPFTDGPLIVGRAAASLA